MSALSRRSVRLGFYDDLGVATTINAATTLTALGGSLMPREVLDAMQDAAGSFVDMYELHLAAGRRLAELTNNEAAYVTAGCAAGLVLAILGARTGGDPRAIRAFPGHAERPHEVIMHAAHRIPYDPAVQFAGATIRQIGDMKQTFAWELEAAISDQTAAVLYVWNSSLPPVALELSEVVAIAHARGIPVIVDAAAQLPPVSNLWRFTRDAGADIAVFSGGKALHGPQASGLMVGTAGLVEAARQNGAPYQRWARAMKAGKEEIAGLLAAVTRFVSLDHEALYAESMRRVEGWREAFIDLGGVSLTVESCNSAGQAIPRLHLEVDDRARLKGVLESLSSANPRISVLPDVRNGEEKGFWLTPELLVDEEVVLVRDAVRQALAVGN
jgi:L-seryl-tRNA(Ser) seleniumtransferase